MLTANRINISRSSREGLLDVEQSPDRCAVWSRTSCVVSGVTVIGEFATRAHKGASNTCTVVAKPTAKSLHRKAFRLLGFQAYRRTGRQGIRSNEAS